MSEGRVRLFTADAPFALGREGTTLILFWAAWCRVSTAASDAFVQEAAETLHFQWVLCDYEQHRERSISLMHVRTIPTLLILTHGDEFARYIGPLKRSDLRRICRGLIGQPLP
jgi:thioredoxin-like negative regulator of GroEL